jgi:hypothetical protein
MKGNILILFALVSVFIFCCRKKTSEDNILDFDEIRNKIESAHEGDIIELPAGTCDITAGFSVNKNITLLGAGVEPGYVPYTYPHPLTKQ